MPVTNLSVAFQLLENWPVYWWKIHLQERKRGQRSKLTFSKSGWLIGELLHKKPSEISCSTLGSYRTCFTPYNQVQNWLARIMEVRLQLERHPSREYWANMVREFPLHKWSPVISISPQAKTMLCSGHCSNSQICWWHWTGLWWSYLPMVETGDEDYRCGLVMMKAIATPLKKKSIPILKLLTCLALACMHITCVKAMGFTKAQG